MLSSKCRRVLLLATNRTVSAGKYHLELGKLNILHTKIIAQAATDLVPLIEKGNLELATKRTVKYLQRGELIDGVILGCTHYSLLVKDLRKKFPDITFFAQTEIIPNKLQSYLVAHPELEEQLERRGVFETHFTGKSH
jgi:glutamate racemase